MPDASLTVQVSDPKRALLKEIFGTAITDVRTSGGSDVSSTTGELSKITRAIYKLKTKNPDAFYAFQAAQKVVVAEQCSLRPPKRALLKKIFAKAIEMIKNGAYKNKNTGKALTGRTNITARREIARLSRLVYKLKTQNAKAFYAYVAAEKRVVFKRCALKKIFIPIISTVTTSADATQGGEITVTVKGKHIPKVKDLQISFLNGSDVDGKITIVPNSVDVKADGKTVTFKIKIASDAKLGARDLRIAHKTHVQRYPKLATTKANALTIVPPQCSPTLSVSPSSLKKGETKEVTVTVDCRKLPANPAILVSPAGVSVSNVRRINDTTLKFTASAPNDATAGNRTIKVMDGNRVLAQGSFNIAEVADDKTTAQRIGDFAYTNPATAFPLRYGPIAGSEALTAKFTGGFSSSALESQRDNVPANLRATTERISLLSGRITLGDRHHPTPVMGRENTLVNALSGKKYKSFPSWLTVGANLQLAFDYNPKDTILGMAGIGTNFIFSPISQLDIDAYGHFAFRGTNYIDPNRLLFSGMDNVLTGGIAFGSNLATKFAYLKAYAEFENSWRNYSNDTYGFSFNNGGGDYAVNTGLQLALSLNRKFKNKGVPNIWLEAGGTVAGKRSVPEYSEGVGLTGTTPENVMGWNILLTAQWLNIPDFKPFAGFRSSGLHQQGWDLRTQYQAIVGLDSKKLGRFDLRYTYTDNPTLHYGEQSHSVSLRYNLPILRQALFGEIQYDSVAGKHFGRGIVGIDVLKLLPTSK
ncbi:MAG: hypothetical protein U9R38_04710 [Candidatus Margulisiibacteriota bacterium]|nr:hypothetical protein [Candidatus Margulisiibacteriota bacterium]